VESFLKEHGDLIEELTFNESEVIDENAVNFRYCKNLQQLTLLNQKLTKEIIDDIKKISTLTVLKLDGCEDVNDENAFDNISLIKDLGGLHLSNTGIGDREIKMMTLLDELQVFDISGNPDVTDDSIEHLLKMSSLEELNVKNTRITKKGLKRLRENIFIVYDE
jgi:hypothetical protein